MIRYFEVAIVAATVVVAVALYALKYDTGHLAQQISRLKSDIAGEEAAINILRAEWALLNQPDRVQRLAATHLELEPLSADQIKSFDDVPHKPVQEAMDDLVRRALDANRFAPAPVQ